MPDITQILAAGGIVGMFGICVVLLTTLIRITLKEGSKARRENETCTRRLNIVINCLNEHGIKVPPEVWQENVA